MLTDEEETILHLASLRGTTTEMTFARDELKTAVASIVAARVRAARAQELRDTARIIPGPVESPQAQWLRDRAETIENGLG